MKQLALALLLLSLLTVGAACAVNQPQEPRIVGIWGSQEPGQPWLEFAKDGTLSGSDGCNRVMGQWSVARAELSLGEIASTKMFCEGVDTWLNGIHSASIARDTLKVRDVHGTEIGKLRRTDS
ncbi:META domain-containing protein [Glutamicibacter uratoxydans]|uniref:META domain-containing protein n=1 Tax=Glutamicibacter uratoxydans TaxID=43667 RepID=UPI003D702125